MEIKVIKKLDKDYYYVITVDGVFWSTAETQHQAFEEIEYITTVYWTKGETHITWIH